MEVRRKKVITIWFLIFLNLIISWVVFYICDMYLYSPVGPDFVEYENWFGDLESQIRYRFGIGSLENLLYFLQTGFFVFVEVRRLHREKEGCRFSLIAIGIYSLNFLCWLLFTMDWYGLVRLPEWLSAWLPQYLLQGLVYE